VTIDKAIQLSPNLISTSNQLPTTMSLKFERHMVYQKTFGIHPFYN
jgi:hypothetical protein